jgi:hypothetical protein
MGPREKEMFAMRIMGLLVLAHVAMFVLFYAVGQWAVATG